MSSRSRWLAVALIAMALAAGCGSKSHTRATSRSTTTSVTSSTETSTTAPDTTASANEAARGSTAGGAGGSPRGTAAAAGTAAPGTSASSACRASAPAPGGPSGQSTYLANVGYVTAMAWAPDGRLFFTVRDGAVKIARGTNVATFTTVQTTTTQPGGGYSERGLLGLALSPSFASDHLVFAMYSSADRQHQIVVRWTECDGKASNERTIITLPAGPDCCHKGGRLAFGPDGKLYVTLGDEHSVPAPPGGPVPPVPQNTGDVRGKILRYNPDGTIPSDGPFGGSTPAWAAGFRNPFGIAFGPPGAFITVNGPTGDAGSPSTGYDLAMVIHAGYVGQWPYCYGYSHPVSPYPSCMGKPAPDWSSEQSTLVPTGATWVDASGPAGTANHFVFCTFSSGMLTFTPGSPHASVAKGASACRLDVKQGPDHALYFSDDTSIYRSA